MKAKHAHTGKGGGKMAPVMNKKGESKTARPSKAKVMSKPNETSKRMMDESRKDWKV
jgi:hypothetical protein